MRSPLLSHFCFRSSAFYAPGNVISGEGGGGRGSRGEDFDKAFMPEGVVFDFMDSPQGADI